MTQKVKGILEIASKYENFIFDMDGVFWQGKDPITTSQFPLQELKKMNKNIYFLTNNGTLPREQFHERLTKYNIPAEVDKIYTSGLLLSWYIKEKNPNYRKAYVIGSEGLVKVLRDQGINLIWANEDPVATGASDQFNKHVYSRDDHHEDIDILIASTDYEISYTKYCLACYYIQKGAKFLASNKDQFIMVNGLRAPASSTIITPIELTTGQTVETAGKPNNFCYKFLQDKFNVKDNNTIMIGDNIDNDIGFGKNCGIDQFLVLTGNTTEEMLWQREVKYHPTYYSNNLTQ